MGATPTFPVPIDDALGYPNARHTADLYAPFVASYVHLWAASGRVLVPVSLVSPGASAAVSAGSNAEIARYLVRRSHAKRSIRVVLFVRAENQTDGVIALFTSITTSDFDGSSNVATTNFELYQNLNPNLGYDSHLHPLPSRHGRRFAVPFLYVHEPDEAGALETLVVVSCRLLTVYGAARLRSVTILEEPAISTEQFD